MLARLRSSAHAALVQSRTIAEVSDDLLSALPLELQLHIADAVGELQDRAALALASPRLLGRSACRELPSYQGLEMSLAFHRVLGRAIDEQLLRRYASHSQATPEGCKWLTGVAAAADPRRKEMRVVAIECHAMMHHAPVHQACTMPSWHASAQQRWYLMQPGSSVGALVVVRIGKPQHTAYHYAGVEGAERLARIEKAGVGVWHIEGEKGAERVVRVELPSGEVRLCDGHKLPALTRLRHWLCGASYSSMEVAQRREKLLADLSTELLTQVRL